MTDVQQNKGKPKIRRAGSTEQDSLDKHSLNGPRIKRRSLSLEPGNRALADDQSNIWSGSVQDSDSLSSLQSLDKLSIPDQDRYYSMDSRLSGGSTQSEVITNVEMKKKKKSLMGTLKKLTKSRSVEDQSGGAFYKIGGGGGSDASANAAPEEALSTSKVDLKEKITGIFRRGGSSSRSSSLERKAAQDTSSLQRPVKFASQSRPSPSVN